MKQIAISLLVLMSYSLHGQKAFVSEKEELFNDGEFFFWAEDYQEAVYYYLQLLKLEPDNANFNFKAGECFLNIENKEILAIPYLKKATESVTLKYKRKAIDEKSAPLHAWFYLGNVYRINNQLDLALSAYNTFVNSDGYYGNYNLEIVDNEIEAVERAKIIKDDPIKIVMQNLGNHVNSSVSDFNPAVSGDEKHLVFITSLKFYDGIFYSVKDHNGNWIVPRNINFDIGSDGDLYPCYLDFDGKTMLLIKQNQYEKDIYVSMRHGDYWGKAIPLNGKINSRKNEAHALCLSMAIPCTFQATGGAEKEVWIFIIQQKMPTGSGRNRLPWGNT
ncbi:MAG: hypothetical protein HC896_13250 [Bacteroidales bacterium]|nr:hypothetical protein [Bacteroidales bacterium]